MHLQLRGDTLYDLEYALFQRSHETARRPRGQIRLRLRMECDDERKILLAALRPSPSVHVNVRHRKSCRVARYTAGGECDNEEKFSLRVLQSYIDEIVEGYLRRLWYAVHDGFWSLVLWKGQVHWFGSKRCGCPLYSMLSFVLGMLVVERPQYVPAVMCFSLVLLLLCQMQQRAGSPSPWRRCPWISHYLRVLLTGRSSASSASIQAKEGWEEQDALEQRLQRRIKKDREYFEKKLVIERELEELEHETTEDHKTKNAIPIELLNVLGKVQAIVGGESRKSRRVSLVRKRLYLTSTVLKLRCLPIA